MMGKSYIFILKRRLQRIKRYEFGDITFLNGDAVAWPKLVTARELQRANATRREYLEIRIKNIRDLREDNISHSFPTGPVPAYPISYPEIEDPEIVAMRFIIPIRFIPFRYTQIWYIMCKNQHGKFLALFFSKSDIPVMIGENALYIKTNSGGARVP